MSIDWPPEHPPLSENENYDSSTISLGRPTTRRRLWDCLIVLYPAKPGRNPSM